MKILLLLVCFMATPAFAFDASLSLGYAGLDGGVYVGGTKTPASFHELSIAYRGPGRGYAGIEVSRLFNESKTASTNGLFLLGRRFDLKERLSASVELGLGVSSVEEKTSLQDVGGFGLGVGLGSRLTYQVDPKWSVGVNASWKHYTYCDSFWGKDIFKDLVIDQKGLGLFVEYHF